MGFRNAISQYYKNPRLLWCSLGNHHLLNWMPDRIFLQLIYRARTGRKLNLDDPRGYGEKLQWIKLYDRKPEYIQMVDKYTVREYIKERIGERYLIPLLGVWDDPREIDFSALPEQFVLKCTHDSGSICVCKDKSNFDTAAAIKKLSKHQRIGTYWKTREWPYKHVKARIIAEQYMEDESGDELKDYKVLCFNGEPKLIELHRGRFKVHTQDFYDTDWNKTDISQEGVGLSLTTEVLPKPVCFEEMMEKSALLSKGIPHLRVDWYSINGRLYFGELTFFDASGFDLFDRESDELMLGGWIQLPATKTIND